MWTTHRLDVGAGEEALADGQQADEVILHDRQHATQPALDQAAQDRLPVLQVLATELGQAGQDSFLAVAAEADRQVDASWAQAVPVLDLDVLTIDKQRKQVRVERSRVPGLELHP